MRDTIAEQILSAHLVEGKLEEGAEIGLKIDQTLTQDATGTMVYLEFETLGIAAAKPEVPVQVGGRQIMTRLEISDCQRRILVAGEILNLAKKKE